MTMLGPELQRVQQRALAALPPMRIDVVETDSEYRLQVPSLNKPRPRTQH